MDKIGPRANLNLATLHESRVRYTLHVEIVPILRMISLPICICTYLYTCCTYSVEFHKATAITSRSEGKMTSELLMSSTSRFIRDEMF